MPAARPLALEILLRVEQSGAFASILLDRYESRLTDPREKALLHELVLGVLRRRAALDHAIASAASRPLASMDPDLRAALRIGAYGLLFLDRVPHFAAVDSGVELVKGRGHPQRAGFVNGVLRSIARSGRRSLPPPPRRGDVAALALSQSHPLWWHLLCS